MMFKRGSKVEVLNTNETPTGSWWSAEIISGNGHFYNVRYDHRPPDVSGALVERVSRRAIRHCPPVLKQSMTWVPGDMIEAFSCGSWKTAELSRKIDGNHFYVRFFGSSRELRVHHSNLRSQQIWKDDKWMVVKKNLSNYHGEVVPDAGKLELIRQIPELGKTSLDILDPSKRGVKRKLRLQLRRYTGNAQNIRDQRVINTDATQQQLFARKSLSSLQKLHVSPRKMSYTRRQKTSTGNRIRHSEVEEKWTQLKADLALCDDDIRTKTNPENDACSICSSSDSHDPNLLSKSGCGRKQVISSQVDADVEIHKIELDAYRATINALYASGPMSWEREALLTSLRLLLHISTGEHLSELRRLGVR